MERDDVEPTRYREWQQKQYARLETQWVLANSVIWLGAADTAEYTARMVCTAWLTEMLLWDTDPSLTSISVFTETMRDAHLVNRAVSDTVASTPGTVLIQQNKECMRIQRFGIERLLSFVPMSRHSTRGTNADRVIVMVRQEAMPSLDATPCPLPFVGGGGDSVLRRSPHTEYTRVFREVIAPTLELISGKLVVYGIPKLAR